ncbi:monovalent cation/H+ antiporter complex subunit F [Actinoplanes subglobosus]|uniref:Monovalent cation/H+ antiporter complex subunit F n=1 Tax=Actinoplanes subglobosus TaxID=1547892 RepID=A0ABV8ISY1_9ACTN
MNVVAIVAAVFLAAAAGMALVRIIRGPSTLDRIVGTDVLLAITVCAIATEAAYSRDATGLPILLGLSLLGAAGSVAVARFADPAARPRAVPSPSAVDSPPPSTPHSPSPSTPHSPPPSTPHSPPPSTPHSPLAVHSAPQPSPATLPASAGFPSMHADESPEALR